MKQAEVNGEDAEFFNNWLAEVFSKHGLVGMVTYKGFKPNYAELVDMLTEAGVDHGIDKVANTGLGKHVQRIFEMACDEVPAAQIAAALGANVKTVQRYCLRHGITLPKRVLLADLDDVVRQMCQDGMTVSQISESLDFSQVAINAFCKANGINTVNNYHVGHATTHNGYKLVKAPEGHPGADAKGYVREHRLVMEAHVGRYLAPGEVVHHIDHDKMNNAIENLQLTTLSEHAREHALAGDTGWAVHHKRKMI